MRLLNCRRVAEARLRCKFGQNTLGVLPAFPAFGGDTQLCPDLRNILATVSAQIPDLVFSNLPANTHVHQIVSSVLPIMNANDNDCQLYF